MALEDNVGEQKIEGNVEGFARSSVRKLMIYDLHLPSAASFRAILALIRSAAASAASIPAEPVQ